MLFTFAEEKIKEKRENCLTFKGMDDDRMSDLVLLLNKYKEESIISALSFSDSNLTAKGIFTLLEGYGDKLVSLDLSGNDIYDEDMEPVIQAKENETNVLQNLFLDDNCLTEQSIRRLETLFEHFSADDQRPRPVTSVSISGAYQNNKSTLFDKGNKADANTEKKGSPDSSHSERSTILRRGSGSDGSP